MNIMKTKAYNVTIQLIDNNLKNMRYPSVWIPRIIGSFPHYGLEINKENIESFKEAIEDFLNEEAGYECTFTEDGYDYWSKFQDDRTLSIPNRIFEDI